ncbi:MAG: ankyrin repeat domain-containing protein, partial [Herminiimonas sp.]|nr:ankyrin repeat domain-containing protein [Herminiimonas sp.]
MSSGSDSDVPSSGPSARAQATERRPVVNLGGGSTHLAAAFRSMAIAATSPGVSTDHPDVHRALRTLGGPDVPGFLPAVRAACVSGNMDKFAAVRTLIIFEKVGSDQRFGDGGNMLHAIAADATHAVVPGVQVPVLERIAILAALGANPNATDQNGNTPMLIAAKRNDGDVVGVVKALVAQGADVNIAGEGANMPIHYAAGKDNIPLVATLLENGARLEVVNQKCNSPMHLAATFSDNGRMIDFLVQAGHRIDIGDLHDNHPIHHAALNAVSFEPLRALLRHGANINQHNWNRLTPLHFHASWATNADRVAELQALGADFEALTDEGGTVLHDAASGKADPQVIRALIACGANPKAL